jgi:hypothetical protein
MATKKSKYETIVIDGINVTIHDDKHCPDHTGENVYEAEGLLFCPVDNCLCVGRKGHYQDRIGDKEYWQLVLDANIAIEIGVELKEINDDQRQELYKNFGNPDELEDRDKLKTLITYLQEVCNFTQERYKEVTGK